MDIITLLNEDSRIVFAGNTYKVLGKTIYVTQNAPDIPYAKILLEDHFVLVISPSDNIAYFGKNEGQIKEFDGFPETVLFNGEVFEQVAHDYQIVLQIAFGDPLSVEGEVEYWDYESGNSIVSTAISSRDKSRADVVAKYVDISEITVL